jgi:predicted nuclease with TOPRIM domain
MQREQVLSRLAALKAEFEAGQTRLREVDAEQAYLRETMLRISGAIQVLEELMGNTKSGGNSEDKHSQDRHSEDEHLEAKR